MIGATGVEQIVARELVERLPARLAVLEAQNGPLPGDVTAMPAFVAGGMRATDEVGLEDWPFILVVVQDSPRLQMEELTDAGERAYRVNYRLRLFVWARGDGFEQTAAVRSRLTLACQEVLLTRPQLTDDLRVDETRLLARFSDVGVADELQSTVAAAYVEFPVDSRETVTPAEAPPLIPRVTAVQPDTRPLAAVPHPAFD